MATLAAVLIVAVIAVQILLAGAIALFNAGKAHDLIEAQVNGALAQSGLSVGFDQLFYDPVRGFTIYNLELSDADGIALRLDRFSLAVDFAQLPLRRLELSARGGFLELFRIPKTLPSAEPTPPPAPGPVSIPDIYFRSVAIEPFSFERLVIGEAVAGSQIVLSPALNAQATLAEIARLSARLTLAPETEISGVSLPGEITLSAALDQPGQRFSLGSFSLDARDYRLDTQGSGGLDGAAPVSLTANFSYPDLTTVTLGHLQSARLDLALSGTAENPALSLTGLIETALLRERGLADIALDVELADLTGAMHGDLAIDTAYRERPVTLAAKLGYDAPRLTIETLQASAPDLSITGAAIIDTGTMLGDGTLDARVEDFGSYADLLAMPLAGSLTASAAFSQEESVQALDASAALREFVFNDIRVARADAAASFSDLRVPWPQKATLSLSRARIGETALLQKAAVMLESAGDETYALTLDGNGRMVAPLSFKGSAKLSNLAAGVPTARDIDFTARLNRSTMSLAGSFDPGSVPSAPDADNAETPAAEPRTGAVDLRLSTRNFRGNDLPAALPPAMADLRISGEVAISGDPAAPATDADIRVTGIEAGAYKGLTLRLTATHRDGRLAADLSGRGPGIERLGADAGLPLDFALYPFSFALDPQAALSGSVGAALDLGALSPLFLQPSQRLDGDFTIDGKLGGTVSTPAANGTLALANASFLDDVNGIEIADLRATGRFTQDSLAISALSATDGERGVLNGKGAFSFGAKASTDMQVSLSDFHLPKSDLADGYLEAALSFEDAPGGYAARGSVDINRMDVLVPESFQSKIPELNIIERGADSDVAEAAKILSLGIKVSAPERVFVRGWGLDAEFGGAIDITGDAGAPQFNGTFSSKRGRYEEFGKRFTLERADLRFQGAMPPSPYLDIEASVPADDVTASILLTGPVKQPKIAFSSVPALPQDEVLSRILFNRESAQITPFQAVQLAQTLQRFSGKGGGGLDPLGMLREATGLDDISVSQEDDGETNVGVGKYLTDRVYLEVEKGGADSPGAANIQIEVTPSINVESEIGQDSQTGGGIFWKRDY